ncbi:MAG: hypothetical protein PHF86_03250 [Candidatus Nanoarchaeia archaeon]|jgi:hypothetical protein|nr:hypothetical protein [Candidatus Nanoarchaeia archaeon]
MIIDTDKIRSLIEVNKKYGTGESKDRTMMLLENSLELIESLAKMFDDDDKQDSSKGLIEYPICFTKIELENAKKFSGF